METKIGYQFNTDAIEQTIAHEWDLNIEQRDKELALGIDKTYSHLIAPILLGLIRDNFLFGSNLLDVGCGLGYFTEQIYRQRKVLGINKLYACDISKKSINLAQRRNADIAFQNCSITDFNDSQIYNERFQSIVANMVLHNLSNLNANLAAINKMLANRGRFIFCIPHPENWIQRHQKKYEQQDTDSEGVFYIKLPFKIRDGITHQSTFTYFLRGTQYYKKSLNQNGFDITDMIEAPDDKNDILFIVARKRK